MKIGLLIKDEELGREVTNFLSKRDISTTSIQSLPPAFPLDLLLTDLRGLESINPAFPESHGAKVWLIVPFREGGESWPAFIESIFQWPQDRMVLLERIRGMVSSERGPGDGLMTIEFDEPLFDTIPLGIAILQDGRMVVCNRSLTQITGYPPSYYQNLAPRELRDEVHPEDRQALNDYFEAVYRQAMSHTSIDFRARHRDGHWVWLRASARRIVYRQRPAFLFAYADVTAFKEKESYYKELIYYQNKLIEINQNLIKYLKLEKLITEFIKSLSRMFSEALFIGEWQGGDNRGFRLLYQAGRPIKDIPEAVNAADRPPLIHLDSISFTLRSTLPERVRETPAFKFFITGLAVMLQNLVERIKQHRLLREREDFYRTLTEFSLAGVYIIQDGHFKYVNRALAQAFGYTPEEIIGRLTPKDLVHPDDHPILEENIRKRLTGEVESIRYRFRGVKKDGTIAHYEVLGRRVNYQGKPAILGTLIDVTEEVLGLQTLERTIQRLEMLHTLARSTLAAGSSEAIAREGARQLAAFIPCDRISVVLFNEDLTQARVIAVEDRDGSHLFENKTVPMDAFAIATFARGEIQRVEFDEKLTAESTTGRRLVAYGIRSVINIPLRVDDRLIGCINLGSKKPRFFTDEHIAIAREVAMILSLVFRQHQIEQALRESELRYRVLSEKNPFGIFIVRDGRIQYVNTTVLNAIGLEDPSDLVGEPYLNFVIPQDRALAQRYIEESVRFDIQPSWIEIQVQFPGRGKRWVRVYARPIEYEGRPASLVLLIDITERKDLEKRYLHAQRMEIIGRLASGIAHDFNNLLTAISGSAEMLKLRHSLDPDARQYLDTILSAARRGAQLTRRLLIFSGQDVASPEPVNLNEMIHSLEDLLRRLTPENIRIVYDLSPEPPIVMIDRAHIEQILLNLIVNARDAMPDGGTLTIATERFQSPPEDAPFEMPGVVLHVIDTGVGIPPEIQEKVFDPFFTTKPHGTGLGLATIQSIVSSYGGAVRIASEPGKGTRISVYLPEKVLEQPHLIVEPVRVQPRALVVSEDYDTLMMIRTTLERLGVTTHFWLNPDLAFQQVRTLRQLDLLVIEAELITAGGQALWEWLHAHMPDLKPIVILAGGESLPEGMETGVVPLRRPFTAHQFLEAAAQCSSYIRKRMKSQAVLRSSKG